MAHTVKVTYVSTEDMMTLYIIEKQLITYGIKPELKYLLLSIGSKSLRLHTSVIDRGTLEEAETGRLYLSEDLEHTTGLPKGINLQIRKVDENKLELGPYIGVFINHERFKDFVGGKRFFEYTEYEATSRSLRGLCLFFSIECIDWTRNTVKGILKNGSTWKEAVLPLPKIIYNRNVENNCLSESLTLIKQLGEGYQFLNATPKLPKWETIVELQKHISLQHLIPETILYTSPEDIKNILQKYPCIYLKPNLLSKGRGIFRVCRTIYEQYRLQYRTSEVNHVANLDELDAIGILLNKYSDIGGGYILQQEIQKSRFGNNPFDLRVLFQKDCKGSWQISGMACRIGAPGSIITSPRSGGEVEYLPVILEKICGGDADAMKKLHNNIVNYGKEVCLAIEESFGNCVELGLDLAFDEDMKLWFIEANGKPLRVSLKRLGKHEIISRCSRRPIEYLTYLGGFESWDTELNLEPGI